MLRRIPRVLRRAVLVTVLLAVTASVIQSWSAATPGTAGWVQTEFGPLGPADRDLLVKVRLAGLWEAPTGQQAMQQASSPEVQEVGHHLAVEHADLDQRVRDVAGKLGVLLPSAPNAQQIGWMDELSRLTGSEYDKRFIQIVRQAHGTVLPVIAEVRAGTRNELVREFAAVADTFVSRHIGYLESTGLVDYAGLPEPPSPGLLSGEASAGDLVVPALVFLAALLAAGGVFVATRRGDRGDPRPRDPDRANLPLTAISVPAPRSPLSAETRRAPVRARPRHTARHAVRN